MQIKLGYLYHIKDEYLQNHERGMKSPTYFTIKDKNILWFIPISSKVDSNSLEFPKEKINLKD